MTTPLITVTEAKTILDIRPTDTSKDAHLADLIFMATSQIEEATNRKLTRGTFVDLFSTRRSSKTVLDLYGTSDSGTGTISSPQAFHLTGFLPDADEPVVVKYDMTRRFDPISALDEDEYQVDWDRGVLNLYFGTNGGKDVLQVSYTAGIPVADGTLSDAAPMDLKMGCKIQTAYLYKRSRSENVGFSGELGMVSDKSKSPQRRWNTETGLCQEAVGMVRKYRRQLLGRG